ncbi:MAG: DUF3192 domain-containing protein [Pseudomonadota bacterium]
MITNRRSALLPTFAASLLLSGCYSTYYRDTVQDYVAAAPAVHLGMTPTQVRAILGPSQAQLDSTDLRHDEQFLEGDSTMLIQYYRSGWQSDGRLTDDEYTPYVFRDGRLVGIGWHHHRTLQPS